MAYEEGLVNRTYEAEPGAGATLTGYRHRFVRLSGERTCDVDAANPVLGVLQNHVSRDNEACTVAVGGTSMVIAGATLAAGAFVTAGADGRAVAAVDEGSSHGIVVRGAAADGYMSVALRNLG